MLHFPNINPTILKIASFEIRWYGVFYIVGFIIAYLFIKKNYQLKNIKLSKDEYETLLFDLMLGVIVGGRLGYVLFYNLSHYLQNPLQIFTVWEGGMSFHGGAIGVIIAGLVFSKKYKKNFYILADPVMPLVSIGLFFGRMGNFINAELFGKPSSLPWSMIFPQAPTYPISESWVAELANKFNLSAVKGFVNLPRHPSQIYEALLEGILLFLITNFMFRRLKKPGIVFWSWIGLYGLFRFLVEFVREPDAHLGYIWQFMTTGQILSSFMIIASLIAIAVLIRDDGKEKTED